MSARGWKWSVRGLGFRDRQFKHRNHALDFAAEQFVKGGEGFVMVIEQGGWAKFDLSTDIDGATVISGSYTDAQRAFVTLRIAHHKAQRNVTRAAA